MNAKEISLGDRMKSFYEDRSKTYFTRRTPLIVRVDGCHFKSFTSGLQKPFDIILQTAMHQTALDLCKNIQGCVFAYTESDEISLLIADYNTLQTDAWFDYSVQKVCSVSASLATMYFNKHFAEGVKKHNAYEPITIEDAEFAELLKRKVEKGAYFDARGFNIPEDEITNYFIWRQQDAKRNSVAAIAHKLYSQKEIQGLNSEQLKQMLSERSHWNWDEEEPAHKWGICVVKSDAENNVRDKWVIDDNIPEFTEDRNYLEKYIKCIRQ